MQLHLEMKSIFSICPWLVVFISEIFFYKFMMQKKTLNTEYSLKICVSESIFIGEKWFLLMVISANR